jgi:hypothetical protein
MRPIQPSAARLEQVFRTFPKPRHTRAFAEAIASALV